MSTARSVARGIMFPSLTHLVIHSTESGTVPPRMDARNRLCCADVGFPCPAFGYHGLRACMTVAICMNCGFHCRQGTHSSAETLPVELHYSSSPRFCRRADFMLHTCFRSTHGCPRVLAITQRAGNYRTQSSSITRSRRGHKQLTQVQERHHGLRRSAQQHITTQASPNPRFDHKLAAFAWFFTARGTVSQTCTFFLSVRHGVLYAAQCSPADWRSM